MGRPALEVADIFREHGPAWREAQRAHLSLVQLKVMSAIVQCRSAALGGHVLRCDGCGTDQVSYNSCRTRGGGPFPHGRHCPKCQSSAAKRWCVFRKSVTGVFGIVTDDFGNATGHFGDVTDWPFIGFLSRGLTGSTVGADVAYEPTAGHSLAPFEGRDRCRSNAWTYA